MVDTSTTTSVGTDAASCHQFDAPVGQHVERCVVLCDAHRIQRGEKRGAGAESDLLSSFCHRSQYRHRRREDVVAQVVLAEVKAVESQPFDVYTVLDDLAVPFRRCAFVPGQRTFEAIA